MKICPFVLLLLGLCGTAHADRDIVYSARYDAPPGSHQESHFHLYRINPDGTGKTQLTFGMNDEYDPRWSANGQQILFAAYPANSDAPVLCRINADGKSQQRLGAIKEGTWPPKPATPGYTLENTGRATYTNTEKHTLITVKTDRRLVLTVPEDDYPDDALLPAPGGGLTYAVYNHNSTNGVYYSFYRLDAVTGKLRYLTEGQFLAWSPDGSRFCVAPYQDTTPYEKRKSPHAADPRESAKERSEEEYRMVWFAPLYVRAAAGGKMQQITPRLSYVTGANWRKGK